MSSRSWLRASLCLAGALAACRSDRPSSGTAEPPAPTPSPVAATPAAAVPVTVTATDFKLELPATIAAGVVDLRLVNHGNELHHVQVVRLEEGKTLADFETAMKHEGPPPPWVRFLGGPNAAAPGQEASGSMALAPGHYLMLCLIPSPDGVPHSMKGMIQPFEVGAGAAGATLPAAADTVRLADYSFESSRPLTPGRHTILVTNSAAQPHELVLLRLAPGKRVEDFGIWATTGGMKGPPPAMPIGGMTLIDQGVTASFTVELAPGNYGFICFVPDAKDGKPHLMHGMMKQITVGPA